MKAIPRIKLFLSNTNKKNVLIRIKDKEKKSRENHNKREEDRYDKRE